MAVLLYPLFLNSISHQTERVRSVAVILQLKLNVENRINVVGQVTYCDILYISKGKYIIFHLGINRNCLEKSIQSISNMLKPTASHYLSLVVSMSPSLNSGVQN